MKSPINSSSGSTLLFVVVILGALSVMSINFVPYLINHMASARNYDAERNLNDLHENISVALNEAGDCLANFGGMKPSTKPTRTTIVAANGTPMYHTITSDPNATYSTSHIGIESISMAEGFTFYNSELPLVGHAPITITYQRQSTTSEQMVARQRKIDLIVQLNGSEEIIYCSAKNTMDGPWEVTKGTPNISFLEGKVGVNVTAPTNAFEVKGEFAFGVNANRTLTFTHEGSPTETLRAAPNGGFLALSAIPDGAPYVYVSEAYKLGVGLSDPSALTNFLTIKAQPGESHLRLSDISAAEKWDMRVAHSTAGNINQGDLVFEQVGASTGKTIIDSKVVVKTSPLIAADLTTLNSNPTYQFYVFGDAGGTVDWNTPSDRRLKSDIRPINNALEKVSQLRGVYYEWKDSQNYGEGRQMGFIAQEVQPILPEVVGGEDLLHIDQTPITPVLVEAVKELDEQVEEFDQIKASIRASLE